MVGVHRSELSPSPASPLRSGVAPALLDVEDLVVLDPNASRAEQTASKPKALVDGISFSISPGEGVAILGDDADGTLPLAFGLLGLAPIAGGTIRLEGEDLAALGGRRRRLARRHTATLFDDGFESLPPHPTVDRLLGSLPGLSGPSEKRAKAVNEIRERVGLAQAMGNQRPAELKAIDRQRVALARALLLEPKVLVLHQFTRDLDDLAVIRLIDLLVEIRDERSLGLLVLTDDASVASRLASDWRVLSRGAVVDTGSRDSLLASPTHEYTRLLLTLAGFPASRVSPAL